MCKKMCSLGSKQECTLDGALVHRRAPRTNTHTRAHIPSGMFWVAAGKLRWKNMHRNATETDVCMHISFFRFFFFFLIYILYRVEVM